MVHPFKSVSVDECRSVVLEIINFNVLYTCELFSYCATGSGKNLQPSVVAVTMVALCLALGTHEAVWDYLQIESVFTPSICGQRGCCIDKANISAPAFLLWSALRLAVSCDHLMMPLWNNFRGASRS